MYSLTGRDLPKTIREKLKSQSPHGPQNTNIRGAESKPQGQDQGQETKRRPHFMSLFDDSELHEVKEDDNVKPKKSQRMDNTGGPRSSTPMYGDFVTPNRGQRSPEQQYFDQSSIQSPDISAATATPQHASLGAASSKSQPIKLSQSRSPGGRSESTSGPRSPGGKSESTSGPRSPGERGQSTSGSRSPGGRGQSTSGPWSPGGKDQSTSGSRSPEAEGKGQMPAPILKKGRSSAILARAAFWDNRIEEGKTSDQDGSNQFPQMPTDSFKR